MTTSVHHCQTFVGDLNRIVAASQRAETVRACLLTTRDRNHTLSLLKAALAKHAPLYHFTVAGRRRYQPTDMSWETVGGDVSDAFGILQHADELRGGGVVLLEDCVPSLRDDGGDLRMRQLLSHLLSAETRRKGLVLVFLEPPESFGQLPATISDQFVRLDVPYPRTQELVDISKEEVLLAAHRTGVQLDLKRVKTESVRLAAGVVGLTQSSARNALRDALGPKPTDFDGAFERLQRRKSLQLHRELAMNVLDTSEAEAPIGLDYLVEYLRVVAHHIRQTGRERARGILLIGPPGTGKTMLARAIGQLVELPVVEFKLASLMNSLLGETERRFAQAFATLEAMAPNVVFIDEIEKAFSEGSERDGGTMMRCTGSLLSWLSDNPYPNFIVATSNNLSRMGEIGLTMTRSERFDAAFFVDVPAQSARVQMLQRWLTDEMPNASLAAEQLAEMTEKFSGADLRSAVKAAIAAAEQQKTPLTVDGLKREVERKRLRAIALYDEFSALRRWGQIYCQPAGASDF